MRGRIGRDRERQGPGVGERGTDREGVTERGKMGGRGRKRVEKRKIGTERRLEGEG